MSYPPNSCESLKKVHKSTAIQHIDIILMKHTHTYIDKYDSIATKDEFESSNKWNGRLSMEDLNDANMYILPQYIMIVT